MNGPTKMATIAHMLRSAAELAADLAGDLSEASGAADKDDVLGAMARVAQVPERFACVQALVEAAQQLHCAPVQE